MPRCFFLLLVIAFLFGCSGDPVPTFTDPRDNKTYRIVTIGKQTWMAENLNYEAEGSKCYGEGWEVCTDPVTNTDNKYKCNEKITLSNDEIQANCKKYGRLYDWKTALDACPDGWYLPSVDDWFILYKHVDINFRNGFGYEHNRRDSSDIAGKYLKAKSGWNEYEGKSGNGTDDYGFTALPGGLGSFDGHFFDGNLNGNFAHVGNAGLWWTANSSDKRFAKIRILRFDTYEAHNRGASYRTSLLSVRCLKDENEEDQTENDTEETDVPSALEHKKKLEKITDSRDSKTYSTVKIGEQVWMAENLNYEAEGSKCYDRKAKYCKKYGRLYDWKTALKACPNGWHLPAKAEWEIMTKYIGGDETEGKKLKATSGWNNDYYGKSGNGTDEYDFAALPGGLGYPDIFSNVGLDGNWWSATEYCADSAYYRYMDNYSKKAGWNHFNKNTAYRLSVRCVRD